MLDAFNRGDDLHDFVAKEIFGPAFTKPQRSVAKNSGFAKIYGAGLEQFAATAGISTTDAQEFLTRYGQLFPGVDAFMQKNIDSIMEQAGGRRDGRGWVTLPDGRRLPVDASEPYVSTNYLIQGGCAVVVKKKVVELDAAGLGDYWRLGVHDELLFEVPEEECEAAMVTIRDVMPDRVTYPGVVLEIDQDQVQRWGQHYRGPDFPKYVETPDPEWLT